MTITELFQERKSIFHFKTGCKPTTVFMSGKTLKDLQDEFGLLNQHWERPLHPATFEDVEIMICIDLPYRRMVFAL